MIRMRMSSEPVLTSGPTLPLHPDTRIPSLPFSVAGLFIVEKLPAHAAWPGSDREQTAATPTTDWRNAVRLQAKPRKAHCGPPNSTVQIHIGGRVMQYPASFCSISAVVTTCLRPTLLTAIAAAIAPFASVGQAISMDQSLLRTRPRSREIRNYRWMLWDIWVVCLKLASMNRTLRPTIRATKFGTPLPCTVWTWQ